MDQKVVTLFRDAGVELDKTLQPVSITIELDEHQQLLRPAADLKVTAGTVDLAVPLAAISTLYTGTQKPPSFSDGPPPAYEPFFLMVERTVIDACKKSGQIERDVEIERMYRQLRRRPDGKDNNPLFAYAQAATRLYMSLKDVSQLEFEAVVDRLSISARHFSQGSTSRNYYQVVSNHFYPTEHVHGEHCSH